MIYKFEILKKVTDSDWQLIESSYDSTCFHTRYWSNYLIRIHYSPFVIKVYKNGCHIGYFVGEKIWRGVNLVTAPFEGIGTYTQGLCFMLETPLEERVKIYVAMSNWLFDNHIASFFQVDDWQLRQDRADWMPNNNFKQDLLETYKIRYEVRPTLHVKLSQPIDDLWNGCHYKSCKYSVNKARKLGLHIHVIDKYNEILEFTKVHYNQLKEVCKSKGMMPKPSQRRARMQALCESLFPNRVLMIEVLGNDENGIEQIMSTGIFCIDKGECSYWTGASYKRYQKYCPNELMVWEAMRILSEKGAGDLNFCGMASYKLKFGTQYAYVPRLVFSKYKIVYIAKTFAKNCFYNMRLILAHLKK